MAEEEIDNYYTFRTKATYPNGELEIEYWPIEVLDKKDIEEGIKYLKELYEARAKGVILDITYKKGWVE